MIHDYSNEKYVTFEFEDECSSLTPGARWVGGGEYYACTYRVRIPKRIANQPHLVDEFIERHQDEKDFWV